MSRRETVDLQFAHSPDRLVALYTDPAFLVAEAEMLGALETTVREVFRSDELLELVVDQRTPNRNPFSTAKEVRQSLRYEWDLADRSCRWTRTAEGEKGVSIVGTHRAVQAGEGCRYTLSWDLTVSLPLVGGKLEKMLGEGVVKAAREREAFAAR
ncbi:MAG: DUF2505 family protein, partial [Deltaproteobacteria bacterium]|nr:DUF2505 family protein [Deltaproteobacteria bacterium]